MALLRRSRPKLRSQQHDRSPRQRRSRSRSSSRQPNPAPFADILEPTEPSEPAPKRRRVTVEDITAEDEAQRQVEEEDARSRKRRVSEQYDGAGATSSSQYSTYWESRKADDKEAAREPWSPFESLDDWGLARWLATCGTSQGEIDKLLKLNITKTRTQPSSRNKYEFFKKIDQLPFGPKFTSRTLLVTGDVKDAEGNLVIEEVEVYFRDPVACVEELLSNSRFADHTAYTPTRDFLEDNQGQRVRIYDEMSTGDWWWKTQGRLVRGATVVPVILSSDKTTLTNFGGNKTAYPVYLTIGNIAKGVRRCPSERASVLLGYLPTSELQATCKNPEVRKIRKYEVFHSCMKTILKPLVRAGTDGVEAVCPDGFKRLLFPILAAYVADHPEQCLVTCVKQNRCPHCTVKPTSREDREPSPARCPKTTLLALHHVTKGLDSKGKHAKLLKDEGCQQVYPPFWASLPHCDIFDSITPDLLHQIHKGVFKEHLLEWCLARMSPGEMDFRYASLPSHPSLRQFKKGITPIKQWTGTEAKHVERSFIAVVGSAMDNPDAVIAARALMDFITLAQLTAHTDETLDQMTNALNCFHGKKSVFLDPVARPHFNIPKLHSLIHYVDAIRSRGALNGYNTESPERLHIDFAKNAYRATNKRNYLPQMITWLQRQEAIQMHDWYISWITNPDSLARLPEDQRSLDSPDDDSPDDDSLDDEDSGETDQFIHHRAGHDNVVIRVAKVAPLRDVSLPNIREHLRAPGFLRALLSFLRRRKHKDGLTFSCPGPYEVFNLRIKASLDIAPSALGVAPFTDRVHCTPGRIPGVFPGLGMRTLFETVLIRTPPKANFRYRVARLRFVFEIPDSVANLPGDFAFVELFSELRPVTNNLSMFTVDKMFEPDGQPLAQVIPMSDILRSCYLVPRWEDDIRAVQKPDTILDLHREFYINDFLDMHSYMML